MLRCESWVERRAQEQSPQHAERERVRRREIKREIERVPWAAAGRCAGLPTVRARALVRCAAERTAVLAHELLVLRAVDGASYH